MKVEYPFEFQECNLTSKLLNFLGFSEYWDSNTDAGTRVLTLSEKYAYRIWDEDEKEDETEGYGGWTKYQPQHFHSDFDHKKFYTLYFLHDMFEDINDNIGVEAGLLFIELCKKKNCKDFIESYLEYKHERENYES